MSTDVGAATPLTIALYLAALAAPPTGSVALADSGGSGHDHFNQAELGHQHAAPHSAHPHFTHPLVTESPLPENQVRADAAYLKGSDGDEFVIGASVEAALTPNVGFEAALPYVWIDPESGDGSDGLGNAEVAIKLADYRFGHAGVVLGAGLEVGLPTGDDEAGTGDDRTVAIEPYVALGYRRDALEVIGVLRFGVPVNERASEADEVDLEIAADLSLLYHVTPRIAAMVELNGEAVVAGDADHTLLTVNPGLSVDATGEGRLRIGVGFGVPVTDDAGFDYEVRTMVLLHL